MSGTNEILQFAGDPAAAPLQTQAEYLADPQREIGNQVGIAKAEMVNKVLRQTSLVSAAVAQLIANFQSADVVDTLTSVQLEQMLVSAIRGAVSNDQLVNAQVGTVYAYLLADKGKLVTHTNVAAIAATLPAANTLGNGWWTEVQNRGPGVLTITPTTSTIDGAAAIVLGENQTARICSDGTNYYTARTGSLLNLSAVVNLVGLTVAQLPAIPAGAKRVTVMLDQVSTGGSDPLILQLSVAGVFQTTGYISTILNANVSAAAAVVGSTAGFTVAQTGGGSSLQDGHVTLVRSSDNTWILSGNVGDSAAARFTGGSGRKVLAGVLDRLRLTTTGGTDVFDAGFISMIVEF